MKQFDEKCFSNTPYSADWKYALRQYQLGMAAFGSKRRIHLKKAVHLLESIPANLCTKDEPRNFAEYSQFLNEVTHQLSESESRKGLSALCQDVLQHIKTRLTAPQYFVKNEKLMGRLVKLSFVVMGIYTVAREFYYVATTGTAQSGATFIETLGAVVFLVLIFLPLLGLQMYYAKQTDKTATVTRCAVLIVLAGISALSGIINLFSL